MEQIRHTIHRNGYYYFNRRVPPHAVHNYGKSIRIRVGSESAQVKRVVARLTEVLNFSFQSGAKIDVVALVQAMEPKPSVLSVMAAEYLELKAIQQKPTLLAVHLLKSLAGDKEVVEYSRDDARAFVRALELKGVATATIRRRIISISAILNYAYSELDIEKRNPFSRIIIRGEGKDRKKRGTFSTDQLSEGYVEALASNSHVRVLFPILGETGCRIGEVVGLRVEDVDLENNIIHIRPHPHRRLKTTGSERSLPLVGYAQEAMREALRGSDGRYVFPQYFKPDGFVSTHASNALNKWIKSRFNGLTAHCLRHTMRDRLRAVEAPLEMIDQIGGWSSINTMGSKYGQGYDVEQLRKWLSKVSLS